jgi:hypothetical protein
MHEWFRRHSAVVLLLGVAIAVASRCPCAWAQNREALPSPSFQFQSGASPAVADFDGDRIVDLWTLDQTGWQPNIAVFLSRTQDVTTLAVDSSHAGAGSLAVRDLDADGDTDMVWKAAVPLVPLEIIVWLNDGGGHFTHVLSLRAPPSPLTPRQSLRADTPSSPSTFVVPPKQNSSPVSLLASDQVLPRNESGRAEHAPCLPLASFLRRRPADRGPPVLS